MNQQPEASRNGAGESAFDLVLPGVHDAANTASVKGQKTYLILSGVRLVVLLIAAISGALMSFSRGRDLFRWTSLVAFAFAALSEVLLIMFQPERTWYSGRAIAESTKTLAWRFSVKGQPFGPGLSSDEAESLLRERVNEVLEKGKDRIDIGMQPATVTDSMRSLRSSDFGTRRDSYLRFRTAAQQKWYADKANTNRTWSTVLRFLLLSGELGAVIAAAIALGRDLPFDFAGIIAVAVASGAAWLAIRQHPQLTSAYRVAAIELALQQETLRAVSEEKWTQAVADAEEAISREHTMWLASRGKEFLPRSGWTERRDG